jgi:hypothetical protein
MESDTKSAPSPKYTERSGSMTYEVSALAEITPAVMTRQIVDFVSSIGCDHALFIPVMLEEDARGGNCFTHVKGSIRLHGGSLRYGWLIRQSAAGLWLSAEFHAVRRTGFGLLVDVTPQDERKEDRVLFAPDPRYAPEFRYLERPGIRHQRTYRKPSGRIETELAAMSTGRRGYEQRRAAEAGLPLTKSRALNNPDPLEQAVDDYLATLVELDRIFVPAPKGRRCARPELLPDLRDRITRAQRRVLRALAAIRSEEVKQDGADPPTVPAARGSSHSS